MAFFNPRYLARFHPKQAVALEFGLLFATKLVRFGLWMKGRLELW